MHFYLLTAYFGMKPWFNLIRMLLVVILEITITTIFSTKSQKQKPSRNYYCFVLLSRLLALIQKQQQRIGIGIYCFVIFHLATDCTPLSTKVRCLYLYLEAMSRETILLILYSVSLDN